MRDSRNSRACRRVQHRLQEGIQPFVFVGNEDINTSYSSTVSRVTSLQEGRVTCFPLTCNSFKNMNSR